MFPWLLAACAGWKAGERRGSCAQAGQVLSLVQARGGGAAYLEAGGVPHVFTGGLDLAYRRMERMCRDGVATASLISWSFGGDVFGQRDEEAG